MTPSARYRINKPAVIHEAFEDEVVVVNLDSGTYYSLDGVGAATWEFIERRATLDEMIEGVAGQYVGSRAAIDQALRQWVDELQHEGLIAPCGAQEVLGAAEPTPHTSRGPQPAQRPFATPVLHTYSDMTQILMLDPIHEVDEMGWPNLKAEPAP